MNKKMKLIGAALALTTAMFGCTSSVPYDQPTGAVSDMSAYEGVADGHFNDMSVADVVQAIKDGRTMIVYFGESGCAWCKELVPVLDEVCGDFGYNIGYVDFLLESNSSDTTSMDAFMDLCGDKISTDSSDGQKVFYFPAVVYFQKGVVLGLHFGTVSGHDAHVAKMTDAQKARLKYLLTEEFAAVTEKQ